MKQILMLLSALLFLSNTPAQGIKALPAFGKVEKADLELTQCSFEANAPAMVLFDEGVSVFRINGNSLGYSLFRETRHHIRIKILSKKGFDYANIKIRYSTADNSVSVRHLSAQTYNLDASGNIVVSKVEKNAIYEQKISKRYSEKVFAFPDVKEGSVIEYEYTLENATEGEWYFQKEIPVLFSRFVADFPPELELSLVPNARREIAVKQNKKGVNNISYYSMENIPSLGDEPYMSCREDYLQRMYIKVIAVDFPGSPRTSLIRTWPGIVRELMADNDFGIELEKNIPRTAELDAQLKTMTDAYQKMLLIHKYVKDNMEWDKHYSIWASDGVKSAWKSKKGNSGEINLILINLLRDADINARPVLVSTRDNGIINTGVAGYEQFNKVLAYVQIADRFYILDATDKITPSGMIPPEVLASEGLVVEKVSSGKYEWGWKVLWDRRHQFSKNVSISAAIDAKHQVNGDAFVTTGGYARLQLVPLISQGDTALQSNLALQPGIKIDSLVVMNSKVDTLPLQQQFKFSMPASATGEYHFFSLNLFAGLEKNPFIADERQSDIFFGYNQQYAINCAVTLPEGCEIDELPKNVRMMMPDTSIVFSRLSFFSEGLLTVRISLEFKSPLYTADEYQGFKEFYKKLFGLLNDRYVYKKKA
jgi:hypothetical protein